MDAVLKGYLKYKAKGAWPKNWKELWFILRHKSDGTKQLEYYDNEKKSFATDAVPKGVIDLSKVMLIQRMPEPDKKSQFIMNFSDGVLYRYFDAPSSYNMEEWVTALNSIIFSKVLGDVVFAVDLHQNDKTPFYGPCDMTLDEDGIIVKRRQKLTTPSHQQQIQWSITHLKRFWVKSDVRQLILSVGRHSPTGAGEFVFTTSQNVQIMHGITAMLNEAKRKHGLNMPMTAPSSIDTHTVERPISTSRSRSAKDTKHAAVNSVQKTKSLQPMSKAAIVQDQSAEEGRYNVLQHTPDKGNRSSVVTQPYSSLNHSGSRSSVTSSSRKSSYDSLSSPRDVIDEVYEYPSDQPDSGRLSVSSGGEQYGKLDHSNSYPPQLPQRKKSSQQSEYGKLDRSGELGNHPGASTQEDRQYGKLYHSSRTPELPQRRTISEQSEYGKLEHLSPRKTSNTVVGALENEYGKLDHASRTPELPQKRISSQENEYGKLQHSDQHTPFETPVGFEQNEYGKLDHGGHAPKPPPRRNASPQPYELLSHPNQQADNQDSEYGRLDHSGHTPELPRKNVFVQDGEYGKLEHSGQRDTSDSNQQSNHQSEYHKLQLSTDPSAVSQNDYGRLGQVNVSSSQQEPSSHSSAAYQNEPSKWTETQGTAGKQHYSVPRKFQLASNPVPSSAGYQNEQGKWNQQPESTGEQNYAQPRKIKELQKDETVPSGYETFKREHGTSVSSAISSCSSDPEDGEYSMLSPIGADSTDNPLDGQSNNAKMHKKQKPTPKPRHA